MSLLRVNLSALCDNYRFLKNRLRPGSICSAVVKADAYGLGVAPVARALYNAGCRDFVVATLDEAVELRGIIDCVNIYVLLGVQAGEEELFVQHGLIPVLNDSYQYELWHKYRAGLPAVIHVDTGMCRLGFSLVDFLAMFPSMCEHLDIRYVMSHLACADAPEHFLNSRQLHRMQDIQHHAEKHKISFANSSGIFLGEEYHFDMVRPGVALYGCNPTSQQPNPMKTVVTATAPILQIRSITKTKTVGYGATYEVHPGNKVAVLGIGYADGYFRAFSNKNHCYLAGYMLPVIGRVSMDLVTVDVSDVPDSLLHIGAEVELIGEHRTLDDVAKQADTIGYEVLTSLGKRYKREYVE